MPNHQVMRFQKMAPDMPHRMTVTERMRRHVVEVDELADGIGHRRAAEDRPEELEDGDDDHRLDRRQGPRGDGGGDDVGGVVEAVGVVEQQNDHNGDIDQYRE